MRAYPSKFFISPKASYATVARLSSLLTLEPARTLTDDLAWFHISALETVFIWPNVGDRPQFAPPPGPSPSAPSLIRLRAMVRAEISAVNVQRAFRSSDARTWAGETTWGIDNGHANIHARAQGADERSI